MIAASVDTRVRVDLLANVMAIVWPLREVERDNGVSPDLIASLCERAF